MSLLLGKTRNPAALRKYTFSLTIKMAVLLLPVAIIAILIEPVFIRVFYPKYISAIRPAQVMTLAGFFWGIQFFTFSSLKTLKAWLWLTIYTFSRLVVGFGLPYLFYMIFKSNPLQAVAFGYLLASVVILVIGIIATHKASLDSKNFT